MDSENQDQAIDYESAAPLREPDRWAAFRWFGIITFGASASLVLWLVLLNQRGISDHISDDVAFRVELPLAFCWLVGVLGNSYLFFFLRHQEADGGAGDGIRPAIRWTTAAAVLQLLMAAYLLLSFLG